MKIELKHIPIKDLIENNNKEGYIKFNNKQIDELEKFLKINNYLKKGIK